MVGVVVVSIVLTRRGEIAADPEIMLDGVPLEDADGGNMENIVLDAVDGTLNGIPPSRRRDAELVRDAVRRSVRAAVDQIWGKKPVAKVMVTVLDDGRGR